MASLSTYIGIALGGIIILTGDLAQAQSLSGATRTQNTRSGTKTADPSEYFLVAFGHCQDAEKAAAEGNYTEAIKKAKQSEYVLAKIVKMFPDWKPDMVNYRREKVAKMLASYQKSAADAPIPTGRQPGRALPKVDKIELPNIPRHQGSTSQGQIIDPNSVMMPNYDTTDRELYNTIAKLKAECTRLSDACSKLESQNSELRKDLTKSQLEMDRYKRECEDLRTKMAKERAAGNELVASYAQQLAEKEAQLRASEKARAEAEAKVAELQTELMATQKALSEVTAERDALKAENEKLKAIIDLNNPEKTKALLDQNLTLADQLKQARDRVAELEAAIAGSADENNVLSEQLEEAREAEQELREQLGAVYDENRGYRRRVSELTERLNNLEAAAKAQAEQPTVDPALVEETEVLKDIIAKQRRTIEMQEEGRKMMLETYKKLKSENDEMVNQLEKLEEESKLELTEAETRMIEAIRNGEAAIEGETAPTTEAARRSVAIETLTQQADNAFNKSRYTAAEQLYRTLYDYQPDHVPCLVNLGTILLYRNKCEEAIEYLVRATRLTPDLPISYFLAGICYYRLNRMEEAEQMFIATIELDPANAEAFFYLGNIEGISGRIDMALSHFAAAVKLKPSLADAHYNMSRLYAELGRIPDAIRAYNRAIQAGAEHDEEFYHYLSDHQDREKQAGEDLVALVQPEAEAKKLSQNPEETPQTPDPAAQPAEPAPQATDQPQPAETNQQPEQQPQQLTEEEQAQAAHDAVLAEIARLSTTGGKVAPTPSGAGNDTTVDPGRFSTTTVRVKKGKHTKKIRLRVKRPRVQRIRQSGGEIKELNPPKPSKKTKNTKRKKR